MRRCWTSSRNGSRLEWDEPTDRSGDRSPSSVGRLDLAADLAAGEVARSRVRGRDAIVRVDVHIGGSTGHVLEQVAHRVPREGTDEVCGAEIPLGEDPVETAATRGSRRRPANRIEPYDDRARGIRVPEVDMRHDHVVYVRGDDLVMNRFTVRTQLEDRHAASVGVPRCRSLVDSREDGVPLRSGLIVRPGDGDGERRHDEGHREQAQSDNSLRQTKSPPVAGRAAGPYSLFPKPRTFSVAITTSVRGGPRAAAARAFRTPTTSRRTRGGP